MKIIITESQLKFIFENTSEINSILDKMSDVGYDNLSDKEKEDLNEIIADNHFRSVKLNIRNFNLTDKLSIISIAILILLASYSAFGM